MPDRCYWAVALSISLVMQASGRERLPLPSFEYPVVVFPSNLEYLETMISSV